LTAIFVLFVLGSLVTLHPPSRAYVDPWTGNLFGEGGVQGDFGYRIPFGSHSPLGGSGDAADGLGSLESVGSGGVIMPKLGNATAKASLGRATWKLLHTMTLRFPEEPTADERDALNAYIHLTSRLYPCGECATEFQQLLRKFPPQTSSRKTASMWLCHVHNQINERLGKPEFDCAHLDATYDCGCGDEAPSSTSLSTRTPALDPPPPATVDEEDVVDDVTGVGMIQGGR